MIASERQAVITANSQSAGTNAVSAVVAAARVKGERVATARELGQLENSRSSNNNFKLPGWKRSTHKL
eukprot:4663360-Pyramimonas_sp.AAC.1